MPIYFGEFFRGNLLLNIYPFSCIRFASLCSGALYQYLLICARPPYGKLIA